MLLMDKASSSQSFKSNWKSTRSKKCYNPECVFFKTFAFKTRKRRRNQKKASKDNTNVHNVQQQISSFYLSYLLNIQQRCGPN